MKNCGHIDRTKYLKKLGAKIAKIRVEKGISQDDLAESGGFSRGTMSKIESGTVDPKATTLARIAKCLNISLKYLAQR
jgi:transcriptional regulator with XRE-family HTH domain